MGILGAIFGAIGSAVSAGLAYKTAQEQRKAVETQTLGQDRTNRNNLIITTEANKLAAERNNQLLTIGVIGAGVALAVAYSVWHPHRLPKRVGGKFA